MRFEDSNPSGKITKEPNGGQARFGINSIAHPNMSAAFWDPETPAAEAIKEAEGVYLTQYWQYLMLGGILNQVVANKIFDMAVNAGTKEAIVLAQRSANALGQSLIVDGIMGQHTLDAINAVAPGDLHGKLSLYSAAYYHLIEQKNPVLCDYDHAYMERAEA